MDLVLDGIYDKRSFDFAHQSAKGVYGFDFRPRSFNFIQAYVIQDLLKNSMISSEDIIELQFQNDSDIVINSIIEKVSQQHSNIRLNFGLSSSHSLEELEKNKRAFSIVFDHVDVKAYEKALSPYCQSVVFSYDDLHKLSMMGQLNNFIVNFFSKVMKAKNDKFRLGVKLNWDSNVSSGIIDQLDPDYLKFEISSHVERCYRNIDVPKLSEYVSQTRKALAI